MTDVTSNDAVRQRVRGAIRDPIMLFVEREWNMIATVESDRLADVLADAVMVVLFEHARLAPFDLVDGDVEQTIRHRLVSDPLFRAVFELGRRYERDGMSVLDDTLARPCAHCGAVYDDQVVICERCAAQLGVRWERS